MLTQLAVSDIIRNQRNFFKPVKKCCRLEQLRTLKQVVEAQSTVIKLKADLNKPEFEAYAAEVGVIKSIMQSNISSLGPRLKLQFREQFPGNGCIYAEPLRLSSSSGLGTTHSI